MPEWVWILAVFLALTMGYVAGFFAGLWRDSDDYPSENAWVNERKYLADCNKEIAMRKVELDAEWEMKALERGIYDNIPFDLPEEDDGD